MRYAIELHSASICHVEKQSRTKSSIAFRTNILTVIPPYLLSVCMVSIECIHVHQAIKYFHIIFFSVRLFVAKYYNCRFYILLFSCQHKKHMITVGCTNKSYIFLSFFFTTICFLLKATSDSCFFSFAAFISSGITYNLAHQYSLFFFNRVCQQGVLVYQLARNTEHPLSKTRSTSSGTILEVMGSSINLSSHCVEQPAYIMKFNTLYYFH